jgi:hypothetical protein
MKKTFTWKDTGWKKFSSSIQIRTFGILRAIVSKKHKANYYLQIQFGLNTTVLPHQWELIKSLDFRKQRDAKAYFDRIVMQFDDPEAEWALAALTDKRP